MFASIAFFSITDSQESFAPFLHIRYFLEFGIAVVAEQPAHKVLKMFQLLQISCPLPDRQLL